MSSRTSTWAWEQPLSGNEKVVLLAIADEARDDGCTWPGSQRIAEKARVTARTVSAIMAKLESAGYLRREQRSGDGNGRRPDIIWLQMGNMKHLHDAGGATCNLLHVPRAGKSELQEPKEQRAEGQGQEKKKDPPKPPQKQRMTYQRRQVPPTVIANAEKLLATFCETSGRRWKAWTSNGTPSPYMIQIVGALLAREDVTVAQWESAIKAVKREPHEWMGDRPMVLGDVFGARSADHSLDKAWKPASSNSKEAVLAAADAEERRMAQLQREKRLAREAADSRTGVNA